MVFRHYSPFSTSPTTVQSHRFSLRAPPSPATTSAVRLDRRPQLLSRPPDVLSAIVEESRRRRIATRLTKQQQWYQSHAFGKTHGRIDSPRFGGRRQSAEVTAHTISTAYSVRTGRNEEWFRCRFGRAGTVVDQSTTPPLAPPRLTFSTLSSGATGGWRCGDVLPNRRLQCETRCLVRSGRLLRRSRRRLDEVVERTPRRSRSGSQGTCQEAVYGVHTRAKRVPLPPLI